MTNASQDQLSRYAMNPDLTTDVTDPRNARFLIPFGNAKQEKLARVMADGSYSALADQQFTEATTKAKADAAYFQCLVDARRMLLDPDYEALFSGR